MGSIDRARRIELLVLDVDGVLTNNQLIYGNDGELLKVFHSQDGLGLAAAYKAGLKTAIITGRNSAMVRRRGEELKIGDVYQGSMDKGFGPERNDGQVQPSSRSHRLCRR